MSGERQQEPTEAAAFARYHDNLSRNEEAGEARFSYGGNVKRVSPLPEIFPAKMATLGRNPCHTPIVSDTTKVG